MALTTESHGNYIPKFHYSQMNNIEDCLPPVGKETMFYFKEIDRYIISKSDSSLLFAIEGENGEIRKQHPTHWLCIREDQEND